MLNVIPLHTFDAAEVLKGEHFRFRVHEGWCYDWCSDRLVVHPNDDSGDRAEIWPMADLFPDAAKDYDLTLDPTDPDTARLIDRRIAEAIQGPRDHRKPTAATIYLLPSKPPQWRFCTLCAEGLGDDEPIGVLEIASLTHIAIVRHKLLTRYYPPVAS